MFCCELKRDTLAQVFSCEFCKIYKNTFFYRKPLVAASVFKQFKWNYRLSLKFREYLQLKVVTAMHLLTMAIHEFIYRLNWRITKSYHMIGMVTQECIWQKSIYWNNVVFEQVKTRTTKYLITQPPVFMAFFSLFVIVSLYNLISVPQITHFLLEYAIIPSKTMAKLEITKLCQRSFHLGTELTLYLKQQTNTLRCFSILKFESSLFSNKLFRCIFRSERKVYLYSWKRLNKVLY